MEKKPARLSSTDTDIGQKLKEIRLTGMWGGAPLVKEFQEAFTYLDTTTDPKDFDGAIGRYIRAWRDLMHWTGEVTLAGVGLRHDKILTLVEDIRDGKVVAGP
jgi:hypothetical protein